jgi:hypothetical protein
MSVVGVLKGASLAFLAYTVPLVVLKRKFSLEVLRSASAFATFVASYRALRATTDADRPVAAGVAALAGCVVDPSFASPLFTFWLFTKGVRVFLPSVTTSVVPVGTLMLAGAYAIPTGYKHPNEVHPTYRKFLESWVTFVGVKLKHWRFPPAGSGKILSDGIHPNSSMSWFMLARAIPGCFYLAAKFNLPLYAAGALAGWNKLDVVRHLTNFLRSVTFLGGYVSSCWLGVLLFSKYVSHGEITRTQCMSFAWIFGLFGLVERFLIVCYFCDLYF